ncbi:MAG: amidohydrolase [Pseudomonadota bacterium]
MKDPADLDRSMRAWRRHLHQNPEFGFEERETAAFVVERLRGFGIEEIATGIGGTGVVATLRRGDGDGDGDGDRVIALRADMDCLRIEERTNLPHASRRPGPMHACGHDGHVATLLGAAAMLAEEGGFAGAVRFVFQPAEEWGQGMKAMIRDGLGDRLPFDEIYGLHNMPGLAVGALETRPGPFMAAEDAFVVTVRGAGGHASRPQECRDALVCACAIVGQLQTIVSRRIDPAQLAVVSVTSIHADNVRNAIAGDARIEGDCRHFDPAVGAAIEAAMRAVAQGLAAAHGCEAEVVYERIFVPLINDAGATAHALEAARAVFGQDAVNGDAPRLGGAEDFAHALAFAPGAFVNIGAGDRAPLHSPHFDYEDDALMPGARWFAEVVRRRLPEGEAPED